MQLNCTRKGDPAGLYNNGRADGESYISIKKLGLQESFCIDHHDRMILSKNECKLCQGRYGEGDSLSAGKADIL